MFIIQQSKHNLLSPSGRHDGPGVGHALLRSLHGSWRGPIAINLSLLWSWPAARLYAELCLGMADKVNRANADGRPTRIWQAIEMKSP